MDNDDLGNPVYTVSGLIGSCVTLANASPGMDALLILDALPGILGMGRPGLRLLEDCKPRTAVDSIGRVGGASFEQQLF